MRLCSYRPMASSNTAPPSIPANIFVNNNTTVLENNSVTTLTLRGFHWYWMNTWEAIRKYVPAVFVFYLQCWGGSSEDFCPVALSSLRRGRRRGKPQPSNIKSFVKLPAMKIIIIMIIAILLLMIITVAERSHDESPSWLPRRSPAMRPKAAKTEETTL